MTQEHPITPPPELVKQWDAECESGNNVEINSTFDALQQFACKAARWGSDQELEACCEWLVRNYNYPEAGNPLRSARRPKPPSLKEQAVFAAAVLRSPDETCSIAEIEQHWHTIRRALEQLDD